MKTFKFTATMMKTTLPYQTTPHTFEPQLSDNPYLPKSLKDSEGHPLKQKTPVASWLNGVPIISGPSFKGALRHVMADIQTNGLEDISPECLYYLSVGGVKQSAANNGVRIDSPNNRKIQRDKFPTIELFGACSPHFIRGHAEQFGHVIPKAEFELVYQPIIRTDIADDDHLGSRMNAKVLREIQNGFSESSKTNKDLTKKINTLKKAFGKAKNQNEDTTDIEAQLNEANEKYTEYQTSGEKLVQTKQLHGYHAIPADTEFDHQMILSNVSDAAMGLMLKALTKIARGGVGAILGGKAAQGCGGGLVYEYEVSEYNDDTYQYETIGTISSDDGASKELKYYIDEYNKNDKVFKSNIVEFDAIMKKFTK